MGSILIVESRGFLFVKKQFLNLFVYKCTITVLEPLMQRISSMENEDQTDPSQIDQDSPPNLGEELTESDTEKKGEELEQLEPVLPSKRGYVDRLRELLAPLYMKVILVGVILSLLAWAWHSASSPSTVVKRHYVFALDPSWYPLQIKTKERNMTAFSQMLLKEIALKADLKIDVVQFPANRLFHEFERNHVDGVISALLPPLVPNEEPYLVSDPLYNLGLVLVVGAKKNIESPNELNGRIVGLVDDARTALNVALFPEVVFTGYSEASQAFVDLNNKKIDGAIMDPSVAKSYIQGFYAGKFQMLKRLS